MKTFSSRWILIALLAAAMAPALPAQTNKPSPFEPEIKAFEAADKTNPPPKNAILFVGSSTFRFWTNVAQAFPGKTVINRGFGGSQISDSIAFADRIIFPYEPRMIVLYAGDNDLAAGKSQEQVFGDFKSFAAKVRARLPNAKLAFLSIKPSPSRWKNVEKIRFVNQQVAAMQDDHLVFIDTFSPMLEDTGNPRPELFKADKLHPNAEGYQVMAKAIKPFLN